jgi:GNAT superfamily N-acetyltransferase
MRALEDSDPGPTPFDETRRRAVYEEFTRNRALGQFWLICINREPVGYVVLTLGFSFEYRGRDAFIDELYLRPEHRGKGIGRRTLQFVEHQAQKAGVNALHLEVSRDNRAALQLYLHSGYVNHDRYLMTKKLEQPRTLAGRRGATAKDAI